MFGISYMFWFVFWCTLLVIAVFAMIFTRKIVNWENKRIIAKGQDDPMTDAEIKRTIVRERLAGFILFALSFANVMDYFVLAFRG